MDSQETAPSMGSFSVLPLEVRWKIYDVCHLDKQARLNFLVLNRDFHEEVMQYIYRGRDLVFRVIPEPDMQTLIITQRVTVALEHVNKPPIALPLLPWSERACFLPEQCTLTAGPLGNKHVPVDYILKSQQIIIHVYESPAGDKLRTLISWRRVNRILSCLTHLRAEKALSVQIVAHPDDLTSNSFTLNNECSPNKWNINWHYATSFGQPLNLLGRCSGDLSVILCPLWAESDMDIDVHTTAPNAEMLVKHGFYRNKTLKPGDVYNKRRFPALEHVRDVEPLLEGGSVVRYRGGTWTLGNAKCECGLENCNCLIPGKPGFATIGHFSGLGRRDLMERSLEERCHPQFPWFYHICRPSESH